MNLEPLQNRSVIGPALAGLFNGKTQLSQRFGIHLKFPLFPLTNPFKLI